MAPSKGGYPGGEECSVLSWVRRMKVTCMTTGVHGRKKVIHEHVNTRSFRSMEQAPLWSICR